MWRQAAAFLIMVFLISFSPIGIADLLTGEFANRPVSASTFVGLFVAVNAFISPDWVSKDSSAIGRGVLGILAAIIVGGDIAAGSGFLQANTPRAATWISLIIVAVLYSVALWMMVPPKKRTWPRG